VEHAMGETRNTYKMLVGKPEVKKFKKSRSRWGTNHEINIRGM
jgi:hypothetical protein